MNGDNGSSTEREPVRVATGITVGVTAILTAFFLVARDLGVAIPGDTQAAIVGAVIIVATIFSNEWARGRSTPIAAPQLPSGTAVKVADPQTGNVTTTTV